MPIRAADSEPRNDNGTMSNHVRCIAGIVGRWNYGVTLDQISAAKAALNTVRPARESACWRVVTSVSVIVRGMSGSTIFEAASFPPQSRWRSLAWQHR